MVLLLEHLTAYKKGFKVISMFCEKRTNFTLEKELYTFHIFSEQFKIINLPTIMSFLDIC